MSSDVQQRKARCRVRAACFRLIDRMVSRDCCLGFDVARSTSARAASNQQSSPPRNKELATPPPSPPRRPWGVVAEPG
eukprot:895862-Rhodomonas_salina.2